MFRFDVITIFPQLIEAFAGESLLKKAQDKKLLKISVHNLRRWAIDKHRTVDDKPYGGGLGMVMRVEPIYKAVQFAKSKITSSNSKSKIILFTPRGKKFTQKKAYEYSKLNQLILICGRYEGVDERVTKYIADETISIGDYVLMGGEVAAMAVIEAVARLIPGVVGKPQFLEERMYKVKNGASLGFLEYPQYTRPEVFIPDKTKLKSDFDKEKSGSSKNRVLEWRVPKLLLSGDHKKIEEWRRKKGKIIGK